MHRAHDPGRQLGVGRPGGTAEHGPIVAREPADGELPRDWGEPIADRCGGLDAVYSSRGAVFEDLDNDGDLDVIVLNSRDPSTVIRNMYYERGGTNRYLQIVLRGVKTNAGGVGAFVRVFAGPLTLVDELHSGRGYQSHWGAGLIVDNISITGNLTYTENFEGALNPNVTLANTAPGVVA